MIYKAKMTFPFSHIITDLVIDQFPDWSH